MWIKAIGIEVKGLDLYIGEHNSREKLVGTIVFELFAQGSKQQSKQPFLLQEDVYSHVFLHNDNPFTNNGLLAFIDKIVMVEGKWHHRRFVVHTISTMDPST